MQIFDPYAIYSLWLREMIRFLRLKSRVVGSLAPPFFFLAFLGTGFSGMAGRVPAGVDYINYLAPGIIGMTLLFSSTFAGMSVLWDREFGFLREIMVAPVSRLSIVLGRTAGGVTQAVIQGIIILIPGILMGVKIKGVSGLITALLLMILISATFIGIGLSFASRMKDMSGFGLIMNFMVFPVFLLSGALFPVENLPQPVRMLSYIDPLTYGVDALRGCLVGANAFPLITDVLVLIACCTASMATGAYLFETSEVD